jgi:hypothetical protein
MKLSRQKLKRIIKEEKRKLLQEQEDPYMQEELKIGIEKFAGLWSEEQDDMFDEHPEDFPPGSTKRDWILQVDSAHDKLVAAITRAAEQELTKIEQMLHDGQFKTPGVR